MLKSQKIELRRSKVRQRLGEIAGLEGDAYTEEVKAEEAALQTEYGELEARHRSAIIAEADDDEKARRAANDEPDGEMRERIELRGKARLTNYLVAAARGRMVDGAESELAAAAGVTGIPMELWDNANPEQRHSESRAVTPAPGTTGVNLDPIVPAVFAQSIAPMLGIAMPRVQSGTYATGTISTSVTAAAKARGAAAPATAGAITVQTASPKRITAQLELAIEDIAAIGTDNFESSLRQNLALAMADQLDDQAINGNGTAPNLRGILSRLTAPTAPAAVAKFDDFVAAFAGGIDGLWASTTKDIAIVCGVDSYKIAAAAFRDGTDDRGSTAFAEYAGNLFGGFWTNSRMPAPASTIQSAILHRKGRPGMRTAVCPTWGEISVDDIYTGAATGTRKFTLAALVGDVIIEQPGAYAQVDFKVS